MALGKPVVTYLRPDLKEAFPKDLPIVSASEATLKEALASLLENPAELGRLGRLGRSYVERYHDYRKIAVVLAKLYERGEGPGDPLAAFAEVARQ